MFVAVVPPLEISEQVEEFLTPRWESGAGLRWTRPETWHVTLAFYPRVADHTYDRLVDNLGGVAPRTAPFDMALAGAGAFPDPFRARVLWFSVTDATASLDRLSGHCRTAGERVGVSADASTYRPHLTAARTRSPQNLLRWVEILDTFASTSWRVEDIHLIESHLGGGPGGSPRYEVVESFPLGSSPASSADSEEPASPVASLRAELGVGSDSAGGMSVREALERRASSTDADSSG